MSFKVGDWVGIKDDSINWVKKIVSIESKTAYDSRWNAQHLEILIFEDGSRIGSGWAIQATPEEIAVGHRIDTPQLEVLEMIDVSPNCEVSEL